MLAESQLSSSALRAKKRWQERSYMYVNFKVSDVASCSAMVDDRLWIVEKPASNGMPTAHTWQVKVHGDYAHLWGGYMAFAQSPLQHFVRRACGSRARWATHRTAESPPPMSGHSRPAETSRPVMSNAEPRGLGGTTARRCTAQCRSQPPQGRWASSTYLWQSSRPAIQHDQDNDCFGLKWKPS